VSYQVRELAEIVRETVPGCTVEYTKLAGHAPLSYRVDFGKLSRTIPAFKPEWNASFGAKELYAALQEAQLTPADLQGRRFVRRAQIKHLLDSGRLAGTLRWSRAGTGAYASTAQTADERSCERA
jgi:hypothetical protein